MGKAENLHLLPATSPDPGSHCRRWSTAPLRSLGRTPAPEHTGAGTGRFSGVFRQNGSCKLHAASCLQEQAMQANGEEGFDLHELLQSKAEDGGVGLRARMLKQPLRNLVLHPSRNCCVVAAETKINQFQFCRTSTGRTSWLIPICRKVELGFAASLKLTRVR